MPGQCLGIARSEIAFSSGFRSRAHASDSNGDEETRIVSTKKCTTTGDARNKGQASMQPEVPTQMSPKEHVLSSICQTPSFSITGVLTRRCPRLHLSKAFENDSELHSQDRFVIVALMPSGARYDPKLVVGSAFGIKRISQNPHSSFAVLSQHPALG